MKLLLLSTLFALSAALCPYGATYYAPDNLCYLTAKLPAQWTAAESICRNFGGHLAHIKTKEQNDFIHLAVQTLSTPVFIGVMWEDFQWKYSDGTVATFTNFQTGLKSTANNSVALMLKRNGGDWQFTDDRKDILKPFVCELPACDDGPTPSTAVSSLDKDSNTTGLFYGSTSDSWYYGSKYTATTIEEARALCESAAGYLPTVKNAFENAEFLEVVGDALGQNAFYEIPLGYRSSATGTWSWDDGTDSSYTNWAVAQPLIVVNAKTIVKPVTGTWYTRSDFINRPFLCQFRVNAPTVCA